MSQDHQHDLLFLLHDVARLTRVEADKRARVMGMTRAQWGVVLVLRRFPGLSQKEVADRLDVEPISVARLVDRLEANGLVERRADEQDKRIWRLHLLPAGTSLLSEIRGACAALTEFVATGMAPEQRAAIIDGLLQMKANLQANDTQAGRDEPAGACGENR